LTNVGDRLRLLWNFDDLDATERRFHEQLELETSGDGRAEVLTQLARVAGLRGEFGEGDRLLDEAEQGARGAAARAYIDLERGRLRRSGGDPETALPFFESAFVRAQGAGHDFVAADAAHMAALAAPDHDQFVAWTERGIAVAEEHEAASYWLGPLLNNLGWEHYEAGRFELALDAFDRALRAREADPTNEAAIEIARYAVGKTLRALGRSEQAIPLLEVAVDWAAGEGSPDGWFHEELAEEYAAVGRVEAASEQARLAIPLLETDDPSFTSDDERRARLDSLS
jgi:tetratricopeptide (TPR) repeat protein